MLPRSPASRIHAEMTEKGTVCVQGPEGMVCQVERMSKEVGDRCGKLDTFSAAAPSPPTLMK